ncbi:MAG: murein biosynthesis integral membrane protein MurJ [bacterium]|nr:murein biosynthesis integral membrane protein MurJ [bacterium]
MTRLLRAAGSISAMTLVSRILGLVRDRFMAQAFGASWVQDTFLLAWMFPNLMRRLLGEGALSAALVPAYTAARKDDPNRARELLGEILGAVTTILLPVCLLVAGASLLWPAEWLPAPEEGGVAAIRLLLALNAVLFAYALPICLCAALAGAMNTLGMFALPAALPILLNAFWIAALLLAGPCGITVPVDLANWISYWLTAAGFVQLGVLLLPMWRRAELPPLRLRLPRRGTPAFSVFVAMAPMVVGMSLNQISSLLDMAMAYYLVSSGAVTYVYLSNRLLLFPHALTAMALGVAAFPKLALEATETDRSAMRATLDRFAGHTIFVTLPASAGLALLAEDVVRVLFVGGEFVETDVAPTALTTMLLVAGLPFLGLAQLYARAHFAVGDAKSPARLAGWLVLCNATLNLVLLNTTNLGTAALALASSLSSLANAALLARHFRRHVPPAGNSTITSSWVRAVAATATMAIVVLLVRTPVTSTETMASALLDLGIGVAVGIVTYLGVHLVMRSPELRALRRRR